MSPAPTPFRIIPCHEWGAKPPVNPIQKAGKPVRIIFHHTAGHHPELDGHPATETYAEAIAYAKAIQNQHLRQGWSDSGQNFLVTRSGHILEGRHGSTAAILKGQMVVSAHCPGQNNQPGIEHEQIDPEPLTKIQHDASVWLHAWICEHANIRPSQIQGHRAYFATACPGALYAGLASFRKDVAVALAPAKPEKQPPWWQKYGPKKKPDWFFKLIEEAQRRAGK